MMHDGDDRERAPPLARRPGAHGSSAARLALLVAVVSGASCSNVIARKYQYEEDVYLRLDGSATRLRECGGAGAGGLA